MKITISLADADGGQTDVIAVHAGLPAGVPLADNEAATAMYSRNSRHSSKTVRTHPARYSLMNSGEDP